MNIEQVLQEIDVLYSNQKVEEVEALILSKISEFKSSNEVFPAISLMNELLGIYREKGDKLKGVECCEELLEIFKGNALPQDDSYATTLLNIATAQRSFKNYDLALEYYNKCLEIYNANNLLATNDYRVACLYNNLSLLYIELGKYQEAINYLNNSITILRAQHDITSVEVQIATAHTTLSQIYISLDDLSLAEQHIVKSCSLFDKHEDYHYSATLATYAQINYLLKKYEKSADLYKRAMAHIEKYIGKTQNYYMLEENLKQVLGELGGDTLNIKGLELSNDFYNEFGAPMIKEKFPEYESKIAIGLVGEGSECFGFDDDFSKDHDFGAGFCMWLPQDIYDKIGQELQGEYDKLPLIYKGVERKIASSDTNSNTNNNTNKRAGVFSIGGFYSNLIEFESFPQKLEEWLFLSDYQLAHATNGKVFRDDLGEFSKIRKELSRHYPTEVWVKKIASEAHLVCQTGQYNLIRALKRNDMITARIILSKFIEHIINLVHLLNKVYTPFYKWSYKSFTKLDILAGSLCDSIKELQDLNLNMVKSEDDMNNLESIIEGVVGKIIESLKSQGFVAPSNPSNYLDDYLNQILTIKTTEADILAEKIEMVKNIVVLEWNAFDKVNGADGRAVCQNDYYTFNIMRSSQFLSWTNELLKSYLNDFKEALSSGRNLITEKYAFMMKSTDFSNYKNLEQYLPILSDEHKNLIEKIVIIQLDLMKDLQLNYPKLVSNGRTLNAIDDTLYDTSYETYLRGELSTYSLKTVKLYHEYINKNKLNDINIAKLCLENTARLYGHKNLESAEKSLAEQSL